MKKVYSLLALLFLTSFLFAQKIESENVPAAVKKSFDTMFPKVKKINWELDFENYQVEFLDNKEEKTAWFTKNGTWLKTNTIIVSSDLPAAVKESLVEELGGPLANYSYEIIERITMPNDEKLYNIKVRQNKELKLIIIDKQGKIVGADEE